jgi:hypothetical protein
MFASPRFRDISIRADAADRRTGLKSPELISPIPQIHPSAMMGQLRPQN